MKIEYKVKEWHTGAVHAGETGALGLQAMLNEPELFGYRMHTVLGGLDQSLLIFTKETGDGAASQPGDTAGASDIRD
ncbi:MAG: hypothetical protein ABSA65_03530 [Acidimicrobiales bacterium]|jgi:hypothetical protein